MTARDPVHGWADVSPLLDAALEMTADERTVWLEELRTRTPDLAERLDTLLAAHRSLSEQGFLETPPATPPTEPPAGARVVGPYMLLAPIGEGGMGTVWLAERTDGEIQSQVAIKFLGAGVGRRAGLRDRFLRERQLLSSLSHRAIVRLLDAGHTSEGDPYLVMEYIDGRPIDDYAETLAIPDCLRLFLQVCEGVEYAHQRLIIHRDLKPSNILVDRAGQPKLLDFGIAKLLDDSGDATATVQRVLTPKYASPEQFRGGTQTTGTDIYSLGAVLYALVTGRSPHDGETGERPADVAPDRRRPASASALNPAVPVDLDYILRQALRPDPEDRYPSVDAFAADIRALLDSRPVAARSGDRWYRTRKFLRRNRLQVAAAVLIVVSLSVGLYVANRERLIADRRFQQVRQLANRFIALDGDLRTLPGTTKIRSRVASESLQYLEQLGREARGDADLSLEIGDAYRQVGEVLGVPNVANLGQFDAAERTLGTADRFIGTVLASRPRDRHAWLVAAQIQRDWMALVDFQNRRSDALVHAEQAASRVERFLALGRPSPDEIDAVTLIYMNVATAYANSNRVDEEIAYCRRALAISDGVPAAARRRAAAFGTLSTALRDAGDLDNALEAARTSRLLLEPLAAEGARNDMYNLGGAYQREGQVLGEVDGISLHRSADAARAFQRTLDIGETLLDRDANDSAARVRIVVAADELVMLYREEDPTRALVIGDRALARTREGPRNERLRFEEADLLADTSYAARRLHREDEARARLRDALAILREMKEYPAAAIEPGADVYEVVRAVADDYVDTGETMPAIDTYRNLLTGMTAWNADPAQLLRDAVAISVVWSALAGALRQTGQEREAASLDAQRVQLWTAWDQKRPNNPFIRGEIARLGGHVASLSSFPR